MRINRKYLILFLSIFITETFIAIFVRDNFIRPFVGDVLVVILIYSFIRGIIRKQIMLLPAYIFIFATFVEILQYLRIVEKLNLQENKIFYTIIGTSFDIKDILCYLIAAVILIVWEKIEKKIN